jgi:hypothetical protein
MRRVGSVVPTILLILLVNSQIVEAGRLWCSTDPVVTVDHRVVELSLAIPLEFLPRVDGPTLIEITAPAAVDRQLVFNDVGFGHGSIVTFTDGGAAKDDTIPVTITASVSIDTSGLPPGTSIPLELTAMVDSVDIETALGTTDRTVVKLAIPTR